MGGSLRLWEEDFAQGVFLPKDAREGKEEKEQEEHEEYEEHEYAAFAAFGPHPRPP
jgi:hypothetical protein